MMSSQLTRQPFGVRLAEAMHRAGPLCVGIDPHSRLLADWGLDDTAAGVERFSRSVIEACVDHDGEILAAALKPQVALFERHGSAGVAVLERVLGEAREAGILTIADAKRGDIGSTMQGYASAWLDEASPLAADSVTLSPFLGYESLRPAIELARLTGRGVFILALTSNPEGASIQHALGEDQRSVAADIVHRAAADNRTDLESAAAPAGFAALGTVGLVVGATIADTARRLNIDLASSGAALLAPGYGAQGATAAAMRAGFDAAWPQVLVNSSRGILAAGPNIDALRASIKQSVTDLTGDLTRGVTGASSSLHDSQNGVDGVAPQ
ncbi:MAG: orotidine-5'-phosphate decarboxylase [Micrococcaceae bacterium]